MSRLQIFLIVSTAAGLLLLAVPKRGAAMGAASAEPVNAPVATQPPLPSIDVVAPDHTEVQVELQRDRRASSAWGRDPFEDPSPPAVAEQQPDDPEPDVEPVMELPTEALALQLQLTGISRSGKRRWAIINREIVQEGDSLLSGHFISRIDEHTVTVMRDREAVVLNIRNTR